MHWVVEGGGHTTLLAQFSFFFILFMQHFLGKFSQIIGWYPPPLKLALRLGNPESSTTTIVVVVVDVVDLLRITLLNVVVYYSCSVDTT